MRTRWLLLIVVLIVVVVFLIYRTRFTTQLNVTPDAEHAIEKAKQR